MGSLNSDGTRISQSREMVRNIGRAHTVSADRTETETNLDQAPEAASDELGTNADLTTSQYSAVAVSEVVKISTPVGDDLIAREYEQVTETPVHQNPPWVGLGGGASDLESVLAEGNTGSGIILTESLILGSADSNGIRLEVNSGYLSVLDGDDSSYGEILSDKIIIKAADNTGVKLRVSAFGTLEVVEGNESAYAQVNAGRFALSSSDAGLHTIGLELNSSGGVNWAPGATMFSAKDTGLRRAAEAIVEATNGSTGLGAMRARRHVEVITMASGQSIELTSASGQVIVVKGSNARELSLPSGTSLGLIYDIKDGDGTASSGNITVQGNGANIDGASSFAIDVNYASYTFIYNGTEWNLI